jgi:PEP-CTERM motif
MSSNRMVALAGCLVAAALGISPVYANPVALPFFEPFNNLSANATVDYPQFTAEGPAAAWTVDAQGLRTNSVGYSPLDGPAFSVTPNPTPTGEIVINVDMGWENKSCVGCGGTGLRLGNGSGTSSENTMAFLPAYNAPPGFFLINGPGGTSGAQDMGWVPALGVLHHVEIHSFPSGLFNIKVTDGLNPANVYTNSFTNPLAYGSDIGLLAVGGGSAIYKNLSIQAVPEPSSIAILGLVGLCFCSWRRAQRRDCN